MSEKPEFIKSTVIGGVVFLVPIVILVVVLAKAFEIMKALAAPLANTMPIDTVGGFAVANLITIAFIVLVCFFAGLAARTSLAGKFVDMLESKLLYKIPLYAFAKNMTERVAGIKSEGLTPVLAPTVNGWQVALEIERIEGGSVAVYLPGSPNPWSGSVSIFQEDVIKPLDIPLSAVIVYCEGFGKGADKLLRNRI